MKQSDGDDHGPPPDVEAMAELLAERYPLLPGDRVTVAARVDPTPGFELKLTSGRDLYTIVVDYLRGAGQRDAWMLAADALDALFGSFLENDRAYRELPTGSDVEFDGAFFRVQVERAIPELDARADQMLERN